MTGMLRTAGTSKRIAYASVFAVVYSITRLFPVSAYVGISSTFTLGETFSPLAGMLFGPYVGALSVTLGTFLDFLLGRPVIFDGLDFVPGAVAAATAGLSFTGRIKESLALPLLLIAIPVLRALSRRTAKLEEPRDGLGHLASSRLPADVVCDVFPCCDYLQGCVKDRFRRSLLTQVVEHPGGREDRGRRIDLVEPFVFRGAAVGGLEHGVVVSEVARVDHPDASYQP